jgi:hypothetical protein
MSGNGVDIAAVYQLLREVANTVVSHDERFKELRAEMATLRGDVDGLRKEVRSDIASLRQTVTEYHASVLGHGILISELERRVLRIEDHLNLPHVG